MPLKCESVTAARSMFWPLEKVPTTMPLLLTATDCSWPAAKPFCVMVLMVAAPAELGKLRQRAGSDVDGQVAERLPVYRSRWEC